MGLKCVTCARSARVPWRPSSPPSPQPCLRCPTPRLGACRARASSPMHSSLAQCSISDSIVLSFHLRHAYFRKPERKYLRHRV